MDLEREGRKEALEECSTGGGFAVRQHFDVDEAGCPVDGDISEAAVPVEGGEATMKADIRCYVYAGRIQCVAARLYQGQTTNFRTPGGGFAPVFVE